VKCGETMTLRDLGGTTTLRDLVSTQIHQPHMLDADDLAYLKELYSAGSTFMQEVLAAVRDPTLSKTKSLAQNVKRADLLERDLDGDEGAAAERVKKRAKASEGQQKMKDRRATYSTEVQEEIKANTRAKGEVPRLDRLEGVF
jgi:hypothetical protein